MKVIIDYEFKAKLHSVEELSAEFDMSKFEPKKSEIEAQIEEQIKQYLLDGIALAGTIDVERIKLNIETVD